MDAVDPQGSPPDRDGGSSSSPPPPDRGGGSSSTPPAAGSRACNYTGARVRHERRCVCIVHGHRPSRG